MKSTLNPTANDAGQRNGDAKGRPVSDIKSIVHRQLIDRLDLSRVRDENKEDIKRQIKPVILELIAGQGTPLSGSERLELADEVMNEVFGFGPLEVLLNDPDISDILVNNSQEIYVEKKGRIEKSNVRFRNDRHLMQIIDRIVSRVGRRIDETSPMVDARLPDGSRVNAIIPPLALKGPALSIRRFGVNPVQLEQLLEYQSVIPEMVEFLEGAVRSKLNIIISGGTGSGKTTLLNVLSSFIPSNERIITIEDSAELMLQQPHVVQLETRPPNIEGHGCVSQRELLFNTLRMRPDRIILGEVRGAEALDMLQAMNTGHEGSLTTIHSNSPRDALSRIEMMVTMSGLEIPMKSVRQQMSSAIDLIVQASRLIDGTRRVVCIAEVVGMEGEVVTMQDIFQFQQEDVDPEGNVIGSFVATGVRPRCIHRLERSGIRLSADIFKPGARLRIGDRS
ncbi:MAG: CpaF family protein [Candidatus Hinthialibacter sp.]